MKFQNQTIFLKHHPLEDLSGIRCYKDIKDHMICKTAFLIIMISEFSRLIIWLLSFNAFWEKFVKVSLWELTLSNPTKDTKILAKWSYQWNTNPLAHWVHIDSKFAGVTFKFVHK